MNYIEHLNAFFKSIRANKKLKPGSISLYMALFDQWNVNFFANPFIIFRTALMNQSKVSKNTYYKSIEQLQEAKYIIYHPAGAMFSNAMITMHPLLGAEKITTNEPPPNSPIIDGSSFNTGVVPDLIPQRPESETVVVADLRHSIKQNSLNVKCVSDINTTKRKNDLEKQPEVRQFKSYPVYQKKLCPTQPKHYVPPVSISIPTPPTSEEVEKFFSDKGVANAKEEAFKFINYNQAKNWMLTEKMPIMEWTYIAENWIKKITKKENIEQNPTTSAVDALSLFNFYCNGEKIWGRITNKHYDELQLTLTDEIRQKAWRKRIEDVSGINNYSMLELSYAYQYFGQDHDLIIKDSPNLVLTAMKIAVMEHFERKKHNMK